MAQELLVCLVESKGDVAHAGQLLAEHFGESTSEHILAESRSEVVHRTPSTILACKHGSGPEHVNKDRVTLGQATRHASAASKQSISSGFRYTLHVVQEVGSEIQANCKAFRPY